MMKSITLKILIYTILNLPIGDGSCSNCFNSCLGNDQCDSYGCKTGYYGTNCTLRCPDNCHEFVCNQTTGTCLSGCKEGFHGEPCDKKCSHTCLNDRCYQEDGICFQGCKEQWHGLQCTTPCNDKCTGRVCDRNGICKACEKGFWGLFCENKCSPNCRDGICIMNNASKSECQNGCLPGWIGSNCDSTCDDCLECTAEGGVCDKANERFPRETDRCHKVSNSKCECCKSGYTGDNCTTCIHCKSKFDGSNCLRQCENGFYNSVDAPCSLKCSSTCKHENNAYLCNQTNGKCNDCPKGYHGEMSCSSTCNKRCLGGTCTRTAGKCIKCANTTYGGYCDEDCSSFCLEQLCDRWNGSCKDGCTPGKYGYNCTYDCSDKCQGKQCTVSIYGRKVCTSDCIDNYRGSYCQERCPVNCTRCPKLSSKDVGCYQKPLETEPVGVRLEVALPVAVVVVVVVVVAVAVAVLCAAVVSLVCIRYFGASIPCLNRSSDSVRERRPNTNRPTDDLPHQHGDGVQSQPLLDVTTNETGTVNTRDRGSSDGVRSEGNNETGIQQDGLFYLCTRLEEFDKRRENKGPIREFFKQMGFTDQDIPSSIEGRTHSMLQAAPAISILTAKQAMCKVIVSLRLAKMVDLSQELVKLYKDDLPPEFEVELRKLENAENNENETASYGNPEQQQEQNGGTTSEAENSVMDPSVQRYKLGGDYPITTE